MWKIVILLGVAIYSSHGHPRPGNTTGDSEIYGVCAHQEIKKVCEHDSGNKGTEGMDLGEGMDKYNECYLDAQQSLLKQDSLIKCLNTNGYTDSPINGMCVHQVVNNVCGFGAGYLGEAVDFGEEYNKYYEEALEKYRTCSRGSIQSTLKMDSVIYCLKANGLTGDCAWTEFKLPQTCEEKITSHSSWNKEGSELSPNGCLMLGVSKRRAGDMTVDQFSRYVDGVYGMARNHHWNSINRLRNDFIERPETIGIDEDLITGPLQREDAYAYYLLASEEMQSTVIEEGEHCTAQKILPKKYKTGFICKMPICEPMTTPPAKEGCPEGWISKQHGCYKFKGDDKVPFNYARNLCKSAGGKLAEPRTVEAAKELLNLANTDYPEDDWWVGLTIVNGKLKFDSNNQEPGFDVPWRPSSPEPRSETLLHREAKDCVIIKRRYIPNTICGSPRKPVCQIDITENGN